MNRENIKGLVIGVIGSLIASGIIYFFTKEWLYGYEPYNIKIKDETKEKLSIPNTYVCGHDVPEDALKRFIQLSVIYMMNKRLQAFILPTLEYLNYTQDSRKHKILY